MLIAAEPWLGADLELHQDTGEVSAAPVSGRNMRMLHCSHPQILVKVLLNVKAQLSELRSDSELSE